MSNVSTHPGEEPTPSCAGATPCALPGKHTEGVSVGNVPEPKRWYVLRVHYGRIRKVSEMLETDGVEYFVPFIKTYKKINGKKKLVKEPILSNFVFVHTTLREADFVVKNYIQVNKVSDIPKDKENTELVSHLVSFYYDHFIKNDDGHNPPLVIPDLQMENIFSFDKVDDEHKMLVKSEQCHFKSDDIVRIMYGKFKGITGRVARIAGQQRVVIEISNLCLLATAYIPSAFLEIVKE